MGPAAVAVPLVAGGIIVGTQKRHHHHQVVNRVTGSLNIGGSLQNVKITTLYRENQVVAVGNLDSFLAARSVPANKIQEAQKLKISKVGTVESFEFYVSDSQFVGKVIVIKGRKIDANNIQLLFYSDIIQAEYVPPQIQTNWSNSGPTYASRGLTQGQTSSLTNAVTDKAKQLQSQWKAISV